MTTNYRSSAHNQKIELIFVIFACRRLACTCTKLFKMTTLQWMKWKRPVIFWNLETRSFWRKKNSFSIENDYIKSWWWCGLNADSIIEQSLTRKKNSLLSLSRGTVPIISYIFRPFIALWSKIHKKRHLEKLSQFELMVKISRIFICLLPPVKLVKILKLEYKLGLPVMSGA